MVSFTRMSWPKKFSMVLEIEGNDISMYSNHTLQGDCGTIKTYLTGITITCLVNVISYKRAILQMANKI